MSWCVSVLGACEVVCDDTRAHSGNRTATRRLRTPSGYCYVKIHRAPSLWEREVHAYERWASAFGAFAPRLLAVRDEEPLALVVSELPGTVLEQARLSPAQERQVWRSRRYTRWP